MTRTSEAFVYWHFLKMIHSYCVYAPDIAAPNFWFSLIFFRKGEHLCLDSTYSYYVWIEQSIQLVFGIKIIENIRFGFWCYTRTNYLIFDDDHSITRWNFLSKRLFFFPLLFSDSAMLYMPSMWHFSLYIRIINIHGDICFHCSNSSFVIVSLAKIHYIHVNRWPMQPIKTFFLF